VHEAALEGEVTKRAGIPVTKPARTLIDLADVAPRRTLERAIDEAEYLRLDCTGLEPRPSTSRADGGDRRRARDRARDAELAAAGWRVIRVSYERLSNAPASVAREVFEALRPARLRATPA